MENGDDRLFHAARLDRSHWRTAAPVREVFRAVFTAAGLPYFNPHSFRKTLLNSGNGFAARPRNSRLGAKTLATSKCSPLFQVMESSVKNVLRDYAGRKFDRLNPESQNARKPRPTPGFLAKSNLKSLNYSDASIACEFFTRLWKRVGKSTGGYHQEIGRPALKV